MVSRTHVATGPTTTWLSQLSSHCTVVGSFHASISGTVYTLFAISTFGGIACMLSSSSTVLFHLRTSSSHTSSSLFAPSLASPAMPSASTFPISSIVQVLSSFFRFSTCPSWCITSQSPNTSLCIILIYPNTSRSPILLQSFATLPGIAQKLLMTPLLSTYHLTLPFQFRAYDIPAASPNASILVVFSNTFVVLDARAAPPPPARIISLFASSGDLIATNHPYPPLVLSPLNDPSEKPSSSTSLSLASLSNLSACCSNSPQPIPTPSSSFRIASILSVGTFDLLICPQSSRTLVRHSQCLSELIIFTSRSPSLLSTAHPLALLCISTLSTSSALHSPVTLSWLSPPPLKTTLVAPTTTRR
ncbi:MAG: Uncharacterised protein [Porticoccaceae bacterium UBA1117]|nr:MAG: Uncharacterised protein [Porticoccaceae bacterium UBA1117]